MFTGIIEELGRVRSTSPCENGVALTIDAARVLEDQRPGASIAVNGVCQTVLDSDARGFRVAAELETLRVTTLGDLAPGDPVNLERALAVGGRLDGHMVLGHVDGRGRVVRVRSEARTRIMEIEIPQELRQYVVAKGCIAVDGVSLTVGPRVHDGCFEVFLIPHTWEHTTLHARRAGDAINIETDVLARYVVHLLGGRPAAARSDLSWDAVERAFGRPAGGTS